MLCPHCNQEIEAPQSNPGGSFTCPRCGAEIAAENNRQADASARPAAKGGFLNRFMAMKAGPVPLWTLVPLLVSVLVLILVLTSGGKKVNPVDQLRGTWKAVSFRLNPGSESGYSIGNISFDSSDVDSINQDLAGGKIVEYVTFNLSAQAAEFRMYNRLGELYTEKVDASGTYEAKAPDSASSGDCAVKGSSLIFDQGGDEIFPLAFSGNRMTITMPDCTLVYEKAD